MSNNDNSSRPLATASFKDGQKQYQELLEELRAAMMAAGLLPLVQSIPAMEFAHA